MTPDPITPERRGPGPDGPDSFAAELGSFGETLSGATRRADVRRRRVGRSVLAATAACAIGLGAFVAIPGAARLDPVAEARAALGGAGEILHYRATFQFGLPSVSTSSGRRIREGNPQDVWTTTTSPVRWRTANAEDGTCAVSSDGEKAYVIPREEAASADGVIRRYSPWSKLIIESDDTRPDRAAGASLFGGVVPKELGLDPDPTAVLRRALDRGILRETGRSTVDGRAALQLSGEVGKHERIPDGSYSVNTRTGKTKRLHPQEMIERRPSQLTYTVDATTFAPVELKTRSFALWSRAGGRQHYKWITATLRFSTFERLDATPANERLLEVSAPAGTEVYRPKEPRRAKNGMLLPPRTSPKLTAEADRAAARCRAGQKKR